MKFVIDRGLRADCRIDFPRVPEVALEYFTADCLLRMRFTPDAQEWLTPIEVVKAVTKPSTQRGHVHVACTLRCSSRSWPLERNSPVYRWARVEIQRLQLHLFYVEPEEPGVFINKRSQERRSKSRSVNGSPDGVHHQ